MFDNPTLNFPSQKKLLDLLSIYLFIGEWIFAGYEGSGMNLLELNIYFTHPHSNIDTIKYIKPTNTQLLIKYNHQLQTLT
jgi:phosphotransferase system  glucose/maltose/N-acetylglucosamine-specific IIC component